MKVNDYRYLMIGGAQKAGTTSLFDWIGQHPEVYANPEEKDFPFFTSAEVFESQYERFLDFYRLVPPNTKVVLGGEANLMYVPEGCTRLYSLIPDAKIIVLLRNPVARCFSAWRYAVERDLETRSFAQAVQDEMRGGSAAPDSFEGRQKNYLGHSLYAEQIERLLGYFPASQMKIVIYEKLIGVPHQELRDIFEFIGVDNTFTPNLKKLNETLGGRRFAIINKLLYSRGPSMHLLKGVLRSAVPPSIRGSIRRGLVRINRVSGMQYRMSQADKDSLRKYFEKDIKLLERITGIDLSIWRE